MKNIINSIGFAVLLALFSALIFLVPPDLKSVEAENRNLAAMPALTLDNLSNGRFTRDFEEYISDSIGFRSSLISASAFISDWKGLTPDDAVEIVVVSSSDNTAADTPAPSQSPKPSASPVPSTPRPSEIVSAESSAPEQTEPLPEQETSPPDEDENDENHDSQDVAPIQSGPLLKFKDKLVEIYGFRPSAVQKYVDAVNYYRDLLDYNYRVFSLVTPTQIEFIDEKYKSATDSQRAGLDYIKKNLGLGIHFVDPYDVLKEHSDEYLFFRTDHHWTGLGAYYAYTVFAESAGFEPLPLSAYDEHRLDGFLGYLYNMSPSEELARNPDYIIYYTLKEPIETSKKLIFPPSDGSAKYHVFMGGDHSYYNVQTSVNNGQTVIIIKDSYANALIPFLAPHYENIVVIDPRRYGNGLLNELSKYESADLVFVNYIFATGMTDFIERIMQIR